MPRPLRYQIFLLYGSFFLVVWGLLVYKKQAILEAIGEEPFFSWTVDWILTLFPIFLVLIWGILSLMVISYNVVTLRDVPRAARELEQQIEEAKNEMKKRGIQ
mmetsp:Transcript_33739/g.77851  ORF Transcript_33739/g.77851 Transcript_33739/m.77851 type:complete len:103 (-) Transcript_33739:92-400(-)|eukprot:CAMPEP_0116837402 /NCGR_PEP_ID=MMETSP0418-20121206/8632_1 /TAXON_ID=1158023 /ORGANISM="Astrosyne radiata, Strain 13vi08-1A" /LENGTH=102 /DNA_ID=CAMNT_0004467279 /DNA_START=48 /DNA_END=356 /DNA_ORIENTATION=-